MDLLNGVSSGNSMYYHAGWTRPWRVLSFIAGVVLATDSRFSRAEGDPPAQAEIPAAILPGKQEIQNSNASPTGMKRADVLARFYRALLLDSAGQEEAALAAFSEILSEESGNFTLVDRVARLQVNLGKLNEARDLWEKISRQRPDSSLPLLRLVELCVRHGQEASSLMGQAMQYSQQIVRQFPKEAAGYQKLVDLFFTIHGDDVATAQAKAGETLASALTQEVGDAGFWLSLMPHARKAWPLRSKDTHADHLKQILTFLEKAAAAPLTQGSEKEAIADAFASFGRQEKSMVLLKRAQPLYQELSAADPGDLALRHKLAALLIQLGDADAGSLAYEELVRINPTDIKAHEALVKLAEQRNDTALRIVHQEEILKWEGGPPDAWLRLAGEMISEKLPGKAMDVAKLASREYPKDARFPRLVAEIFASNSKAAAALPFFAEALQIATANPDKPITNAVLPQDPQFYFSWAQSAHQSGDVKGAEAHFRKTAKVAADKNPELAARSYASIARMWLERSEKIEEAGELLRTSAPSAPEAVELLLGKGLWHWRKNELNEALKLLESAEKALSKPSASVLEPLAAVLYGLGRLSEAKDRLSSALKCADASPDGFLLWQKWSK